MKHQVFTVNGTTYILNQVKPLRYTLDKVVDGVVVDFTSRFQSLTGVRLHGWATDDASLVLGYVRKAIITSELAI